MTKEEFENMTSTSVSDQEFKEIGKRLEKLDIHKSMFCDLWVNNPEALEYIEESRRYELQLEEENEKLIDFLIDQAQKLDASEIMHMAVRMAGPEGYLNKKLAKGYELNEDDKQLLIAILR